MLDATPAPIRAWRLPFDVDDEFADRPAPGRTGWWRFADRPTFGPRHLVHWQLIGGRLLAIAACGARRTTALHTTPGAPAASRCASCVLVLKRRRGRVAAKVLQLDDPRVLAELRARRARQRRLDAARRRRRGGNPYDPLPGARDAAA